MSRHTGLPVSLASTCKGYQERVSPLFLFVPVFVFVLEAARSETR